MQWWGRYEYYNRYEYPLFRYWPTLLSLFIILTFSWSRCVDYPSFIETASEQFAKELENRAIKKRANYVKVGRG